MSVQYQTVVGWDTTLIDLEYTDTDTAPTALQGLVKFAIKTTTGAPTATAGKFLEAAQILNAVDSTWYENTGTTAAPTWSLVPSSGSGISQLTGDVTAGPGSGSQAATIAVGAVTKAKLATGVKASHMIMYAGQPTTVGGAVAEAFTVTGAAATDYAFVQVVNNGTNNVTALQAVVTLNTLTITFSGDPSSDTVINYQIVRATS